MSAGMKIIDERETQKKTKTKKKEHGGGRAEAIVKG